MSTLRPSFMRRLPCVLTLLSWACGWQRDTFQHAVHEIYVSRRPRSPAHRSPEQARGYDDMWAHSTDTLLVPRTPARLRQLHEAWMAGAEVRQVSE